MEETTIDDWDVNLGDLTLLERIGEGFFGVVVKAVLYRNPSNRLNMQCGVRRQSGDNEYKSVVACKMLKGAKVFRGYILALYSSSFPEQQACPFFTFVVLKPLYFRDVCAGGRG